MSLGKMLGRLLGSRRGKPAVGGNLDPATLKKAETTAASRAAGPGVSRKYVQDPQSAARRRELIRKGIETENRRLGK